MHVAFPGGVLRWQGESVVCCDIGDAYACSLRSVNLHFPQALFIRYWREIFGVLYTQDLVLVFGRLLFSGDDPGFKTSDLHFYLSGSPSFTYKPSCLQTATTLAALCQRGVEARGWLTVQDPYHSRF